MASIVIPRITVRAITWRTTGPYSGIHKIQRTQCCTQHAWCSTGGAMLLQCVESTRTSRHHASRYPPKDEMGGVTQMTRVMIPRIMVS